MYSEIITFYIIILYVYHIFIRKCKIYKEHNIYVVKSFMDYKNITSSDVEMR